MPPNPLLERIISLLKDNQCIGGYSETCENNHVPTPFVDVLGSSWIIQASQAIFDAAFSN
jgi:hypothetical protein